MSVCGRTTGEGPVPSAASTQTRVVVSDTPRDLLMTESEVLSLKKNLPTRPPPLTVKQD